MAFQSTLLVQSHVGLRLDMALFSCVHVQAHTVQGTGGQLRYAATTALQHCNPSSIQAV